MKNWCIFPLSSLPCTSNWCFSYKWGPATSHKDCFDPMRLQPPTNHRAGSHPIMQLPPHLIRINKGRLVDYLPTCLQRARQQPEILAHLMAGLGAMCKHDPGAKLCSLWDSEPGEIYPSFQHFNSKCENIMFIMITQQHWLQREKKNHRQTHFHWETWKSLHRLSFFKAMHPVSGPNRHAFLIQQTRRSATFGKPSPKAFHRRSFKSFTGPSLEEPLEEPSAEDCLQCRKKVPDQSRSLKTTMTWGMRTSET